MSFICVGAGAKPNQKFTYSIMSVKTNKITEVPTLPESISFNLKKYESGLKKAKKVYTVLGEVSFSLDYKSFLGYLVRDSNGVIDIYSDVELINIAKKYTIMNYSLVEKDKKYYLRRNANNPLTKLTDDEILKLYHLSFDNLGLHTDMNLEEIEYCMSRNKFELGYREEYLYTRFNSNLKCDHRIYFNKDGTLIRLTYAGNRGLNYFRNTCVIMGHINSKKYIETLRDRKYDMGSSCPVDGPKTDIMINEYTIEDAFIRISKDRSKYSTPCLPYYLSPTLDGNTYMLYVNEKQYLWINPYVEDLKKTKLEGTLGSFIHTYIGLCNIKKYSPKLQNFYKNYLDNFEKIIEFEAEYWCKSKDKNKIKANKKLMARVRIDIDKAFKEGKL